MLLLTNQDRDRTYEYTGQPLYVVPVISPQGQLWGFNLFVEGVTELLGTFDSMEEISAEIDTISRADETEHYIGGWSDYDGIEDFDSLCAYVDGMSEEEYNREMD